MPLITTPATSTWDSWIITDATDTSGTATATTGPIYVWGDDSGTGTAITTSPAITWNTSTTAAGSNHAAGTAYDWNAANGGTWQRAHWGRPYARPRRDPRIPQTPRPAEPQADPVWRAWIQMDADERARLEAEERRRIEAEEQRQQLREQQAQLRREREAQRLAANERAMVLLRSLLNERQRRDLAEHGYFFVTAPSGRMYRIRKGRAGNIDVVNPQDPHGPWVERLCVHPRELVPDADTMATQKLMLESGGEDALRQFANIRTPDHRYIHHAERGLLTADRYAEIIPIDRARDREAA